MIITYEIIDQKSNGFALYLSDGREIVQIAKPFVPRLTIPVPYHQIPKHYNFESREEAIEYTKLNFKMAFYGVTRIYYAYAKLEEAK